MLFFLALPVGIFLLDYLVKEHVDRTEEVGKKHPIFKDKIFLTKAYNRGAAFQIAEDKQEFITGMSFGVTVFLALGYFTLIGKKECKLLKIGAGCMLGGALGNLYDRMKRQKVIDYINIRTRILNLQKIIFNAADFFILIGGIITAIWAIFHKERI